MFISLFAIIGCLFLIVIVYKLFLSTSDEIPVSSKLPELPKSDQVYQPPEFEKKPTLNSTSGGFQKHKHVSEAIHLKRPRPAIFYEGTYEGTGPKLHQSEQEEWSKPKDKYSDSTRFQKLCERPNLISFNTLVATADFGFKREDKTHYCLCLLFYPFLTVFRLVLYIASWIGTLFFNIVIRMIIEAMIRLVGWLIRVLVHSLFH